MGGHCAHRDAGRDARGFAVGPWCGFRHVEDGLKALGDRIDGVRRGFGGRLDGVREEFGGRLERMDGRLGRMDHRIEGVRKDIGERLDRMGERLDRARQDRTDMEARLLAAIEGRPAESPG